MGILEERYSSDHDADPDRSSAQAGPAAVVLNEGCGSLSCIYVEVEVQAMIDRMIWMKSTLGQPADDRRAGLGCDTRYGGGFSRSCMSGPK